ncbi:uncharacterized protein LOC135078647 [Ostrinia nubilalis]|uniref:uncharacterized protein LOC135078647 n=1 Tax=Ostrinia nubilalis TaxID=29057 RepID=UPI00308263A9
MSNLLPFSNKTGCPSNLYNILLNYIEEREIGIQFADSQVSKTMSRGCIQGSVIGPTLWNLILDQLLLTPLPDGCHLQAYADDIFLIAHSKSHTILENIINIALDRITSWGESVKLEFGPDKTQTIAFTNKAAKCKLFMKGLRLTYTDHIKYLGIIIDQRLTFTKHVDYIINKVKTLYNKLSIFIRPTWGVHSENVRTIYEHVIEPIICYGAGIWTCAQKYKYITQRLLSIQRLFAIKIIRGFRTVSTAAAITLSQLTPLPAKVAMVADIETTKLSGTTSFLPRDINIEKPCHPSKFLHPSERIGIQFEEITSSSDLNQAGANHTWLIYTDGSKIDDCVGAAFVVKDSTNSQPPVVKRLKLHGGCSVFQAEMLAIQRACKYILDFQLPNALILSDSRSGLTELQNGSTHNQLAVDIHRLLYQARSSSLDIEFAWIKAHAGFDGNEEADSAAKAAAKMHKSPDYRAVPISLVKHHNRHICEVSAEKLYMDPNTCVHTRSLLPSFNTLREFTKIIRPDFAITQVLTNHGYHKSYLKRFHIVADDHCPCDDQTPQTWEHLLTQCPRFVTQRHIHETTSRLLNVNPYNLIDITKKEETTNSFKIYITYIVNSLKDFNK